LTAAALAVLSPACGSEELPQGLQEGFQLNTVAEVRVTAQAGSAISGEVVTDPQVVRPIIGLLSSAQSTGGVDAPFPQGDTMLTLVTPDPYRLYALRLFRQENRMLDPQTGTWYELPLGLTDLLPPVGPQQQQQQQTPPAASPS
jgi:hypothetical protein